MQYLGQITVNAIIYQQASEGHFHPKAVWHDNFSINVLEETPEEAIKKLQKLIEVLKDDGNKENRPVPAAQPG